MIDKKIERYAKLYALSKKVEAELKELKPYIIDRFGDNAKVDTAHGLVQTYETTRWSYSDNHKKTSLAFKQTLSDLEDQERLEGIATPQTSIVVKCLVPKNINKEKGE